MISSLANSYPPGMELNKGESINDLTYIPDGNFSGSDEFTVSVTDSGATERVASLIFLK